MIYVVLIRKVVILEIQFQFDLLLKMLSMEYFTVFGIAKKTEMNKFWVDPMQSIILLCTSF